MSDMVFECPHCEKSLKVDASTVGMQVDCPECGQQIEIPSGVPQEQQEELQVHEEHQHKEALPSDTAQEDSDLQDSEPSPPLADSKPMSPVEFRQLLEETSRSIIPQLEEASAVIRKKLG